MKRLLFPLLVLALLAQPAHASFIYLYPTVDNTPDGAFAAYGPKIELGMNVAGGYVVFSAYGQSWLDPESTWTHLLYFEFDPSRYNAAHTVQLITRPDLSAVFGELRYRSFAVGKAEEADGSAHYGTAVGEIIVNAPVPEPSTIAAGALLLIPFAVQFLRRDAANH